MSLGPVLLAPFALLLPAAAAVDAGPAEQPPGLEATAPVSWSSGEGPRLVAPVEDPAGAASSWPDAPVGAWPGIPFERASDSFRPQPAWQVRVEERIIIRITPRAPMQLRPDMIVAMPGGDAPPHFSERRIGKCLPVAGIAGVQPSGASSLILYMRDRRLISADLDRTCRARDFYSGFYLSRSEDGQMCVDRDSLQARNGASCKLTRIRQLVEPRD